MYSTFQKTYENIFLISALASIKGLNKKIEVPYNVKYVVPNQFNKLDYFFQFDHFLEAVAEIRKIFSLLFSKIEDAKIFLLKGLDHLAHSWGVLAVLWVPNEIDSLNFQHMLLF